MQEKESRIIFRITKKDKNKIQNKAKKCGLSLSEFIRKCCLEKEIYSIPNEKYREIYLKLNELKNNIYNLNIEHIKNELEEISSEILKLYNSNMEV